MNEPEPAVPVDSLSRFRRWIAVGLGISLVGYVAYALVRGFDETASELAGFRWSLYVPVLLLTLVNYGLRYAKWAWLLKRLDIHVPHAANIWIFTAGLAMVPTPGKAGEVLKAYFVRTIHGAPMARTIPVLVAERATDGIAVVLLAAFGVSTFYAEGARIVALTIAITIAGLIVIASKPLSLGLIRLIGRLPRAETFAERLEVFYLSLRTCLSPWPLFVTTIVSLVAWWAECVGYWLIFRGLGADVGLDASTFLYAFATVFGAPSPGGMGMADAALVEVALAILPTLQSGEAIAAALLVRVATLWFGVLLGAFAMIRMEHVIQRFRVTPVEA